eukprot:TRINITY_DN35533_c0_g1_i1.p1 TRINITY_DN35533_c0_g1~~TRINITY_DN35533_c0_g1_i1.p1  ORF type:complete len:313 (+),score=93.53 TRINITY_DN35533_c0_g1_i1:77-1015(+)
MAVQLPAKKGAWLLLGCCVQAGHDAGEVVVGADKEEDHSHDGSEIVCVSSDDAIALSASHSAAKEAPPAAAPAMLPADWERPKTLLEQQHCRSEPPSLLEKTRLLTVPRLTSCEKQSPQSAVSTAEPSSSALSPSAASCSKSAGDCSTGEASGSPANSEAEDGLLSFPELRGSWVLHRIDGNMEALMVEGGCSWSLRAMAKKLNYGVGFVVHTIEERDDKELQLHIAGGLTTYHILLDRMAGIEKESVCEMGNPAFNAASTDGRRLIMKGRSKKDGSLLHTNARSVVGDELVQEIYPHKGDYVVRRVFKRKS